jgi:hypothetical protein
MGNAYPTSGHRREFSSSPSVHADPAWNQEVNTERTSLIEENVRLRALVVQLSTLVLRNVVDQHSTTPIMPARRSLPD